MIPVFELEGCRWIVIDEVEGCDSIASNGRFHEDCEGDGGVQVWNFAFRIEAGSASRVKETGYRHRFERSS